MAEVSAEQWAVIRKDREENRTGFGELSKRYSVPKDTIKSRARREKWGDGKDGGTTNTPPLHPPCTPLAPPGGDNSQENDSSDGKLTNRAGLARHFGVALTTVDRWRDAGCPRHGAEFDIAEVTEWRRQRADAEEGGEGEVIGKAAAELERTVNQARKEKAMAVKTEMDNAERAKELIRVEVMVEVVQKVAAMVGTSLDAMVMEIKRACPFLPNQGMELIKKTVARCRNNMVQMVSEQIREWMLTGNSPE